jgi:hypothetical protein
MMRPLLAIGALGTGLLVSGCSTKSVIDSGETAYGTTDSGDDTADDSGTDSGTDSVDPICADAPVVTWDSWGQGFLSANCQSCHSSTTLDRHGAPDDIIFDDRDTALAVSDRILARSAGDNPTMPPSGGVSEDDRYRLEVWLTCWE